MKLYPHQLVAKKTTQEKIAMFTAYDLSSARIAEAAGIDMILVGDSLANVMLGRPSTRDIGMQEMLLFVEAVANGAPNTHIVADMPWKSDHSVENACKNAQLLMNAGADSVKIEGAHGDIIAAVASEVAPVVAHLGLTPQTATSFKQHGQNPSEAKQILQEAQAVVQAGAFALVLEHIPDTLGKEISEQINIPTIGIGAGKDCDGQVLVYHDALGLTPGKKPPFVKEFAHLFNDTKNAIEEYINWVKN
jgi:3-methyl-2-oxobutanoate hydroxymethyltransferase